MISIKNKQLMNIAYFLFLTKTIRFDIKTLFYITCNLSNGY